MRALSFCFCLADCPFSFQITDSPNPMGAQIITKTRLRLVSPATETDSHAVCCPNAAIKPREHLTEIGV